MRGCGRRQVETTTFVCRGVREVEGARGREIPGPTPGKGATVRDSEADV